MRRKLALSVCTLFIFVSGFSQKHIEDEINVIRKEYSLISNCLNDFEKIQYTLPDNLTSYTSDINFTGYFSNGALKLLIAEMKSSSGFQRQSLYFKNSEIFFAFNEKFSSGTETQERFYFKNDTIIKALLSKRNSTDTLNFLGIQNEIHPEFGKEKNQSVFDYGRAKETTYLFLDNYPDFEENKKKEYMNLIKTERDKILNNQSCYRVESADYQSEAYWYNTSFTGYFDELNDLRLLTYTLSDEGYETEYQYFYNQGEVFYIFRNNIFEPADELSEEQIFIYNGKVLEVHVKKKSLNDNTSFKDIEPVIEKECDKEIYRDRPRWQREVFLSILD